MLSSGAVSSIAKATVLSALQSLAFVAVGASQGLAAVGFAMIMSTAVHAYIWLRVTTKQVGLPLLDLLRALRKSAMVALIAGIGPAFALSRYGPYPEGVVAPLAVGGFGGLFGFVAGIMVVRHPLRDEIMTIWSKFVRKTWTK